jgi:hypothetical protein
VPNNPTKPAASSAVPDRALEFDSIFVLELLGPQDRKTGRELFHSTIEPLGRTHGVHTGYVAVSSKETLVPDLWAIHRQCQHHRLSPIIHIESHGTNSGLVAPDGLIIPWEALVPALRAINQTSEMNLVVTLAACHGMEMVRVLSPLEPAPVWGLFGPNEQVHESEVAQGYRTYYETLLNTLDFSAARTALQSAVWLPDSWIVRSAEFFFAIVYGHYLETIRRSGEQAERERRLVARLRRRARKNPRQPASVGVRTAVRRALADEEGEFQRLRQRFLMLDRFPQNASRFQLNRESCLKLWEQQRNAFESKEDV